MQSKCFGLFCLSTCYLDSRRVGHPAISDSKLSTITHSHLKMDGEGNFDVQGQKNVVTDHFFNNNVARESFTSWFLLL